MVAGGGILKIMHGDGIILKDKKRTRGYYYLAGSPARGGASVARRSPERGEAPGRSGLGMRCET